jgi:hypothetical protein
MNTCLAIDPIQGSPCIRGLGTISTASFNKMWKLFVPFCNRYISMSLCPLLTCKDDLKSLKAALVDDHETLLAKQSRRQAKRL